MIELLILYTIVTIVIGIFLYYLTTKPLTIGDYVLILLTVNGLAVLVTGLFALARLIL